MTDGVRETVKDELDLLLIAEAEGEYINYVRDRYTDEELLFAYKIGLAKGHHDAFVARNKK